MIIAVDFDGTLVDHRYPDVGSEVPGAVGVLAELVEAGHKLMLFTMRSPGGSDGDTLAPALAWCDERGIEWWGVNATPDQANWTASTKAYAHVYIDDAALGCPLRQNPRMGGRPIVDWTRVRGLLVQKGALR